MGVVLIGESHPDLRYAFELVFRRAGDQVLLAGDGASTLATAAAADVDVVVLNLPGNTGPRTCRALRASRRHAHTPVLLLSADHEVDARAARDCGANKFMTKPLDNPVLVACVHDLMAAQRPGQPGPAPVGSRIV